MRRAAANCAATFGAHRRPLLQGTIDRKLSRESRWPAHQSRRVMMDTLLLLALNGLIWGLIIALIA
ncbi:MAG TPA: hypothetical protein VNM70_05710, partial [Burkholderiales bacterium]|nr:hypothetical protein [Burkholderiales bacterium]